MQSFFNPLRRREMIASVTAATTALATDALSANTAEATDVVKRFAPRGYVGIAARLPTLELEGKGDFFAAQYQWRGQALERAAELRAMEICKAAGVDDATQKDMSWAQAVALLSEDPLISMTCRARSSQQKLKYRMLQLYFHDHADEYLSEMERADKAGPGTLEMNPKMYIPEYTAHEIHSMPGGYVGDEFAGHMYHGGTNFSGSGDVNYQDTSHMAMASAVPVPKDGKVRRILDLGTSIGQFATSMKRRFPEAEVWGIDIGAPMVRYAHLKAAGEGIAVNFAQRLAEDTKFPDNHFDIVTSHLLFHEVNTTGAKGIIKELSRVLRPGGVFAPTDMNGIPPSAKGKYSLWYNYRWNHEDWYPDWYDLDFAGELTKNGLRVTEAATEDKVVGGTLVGTQRKIVGMKI